MSSQNLARATKAPTFASRPTLTQYQVLLQARHTER